MNSTLTLFSKIFALPVVCVLYQNGNGNLVVVPKNDPTILGVYAIGPFPEVTLVRYLNR